MFLQKLEILGFKSFANRTEMDFLPPSGASQGITGVVGPNGSGKSNVADAIRWVLGEQSIKTLRGKKSEDVIFSGSEKRPRSGYAEVSLFLN
ncbi:MAG: AAA family ATPase, partial [Patescibacteria group bacterium]